MGPEKVEERHMSDLKQAKEIVLVSACGKENRLNIIPLMTISKA